MKILTALGNNFLYQKLKNDTELKIYKNDILYREGILEILKIKKEFDLIIIYEKLPGEISFEKIIENIKIINKKIKIIFLLENKNNNLEKILYKNKINNFFYINEFNYDKFILKIKNKKINNKKINNKKLIKNNYEKNNFNKIIIISDLNYYEFNKIKNKINKLINKNNNYFNIIKFNNKKILKNKFNKKINNKKLIINKLNNKKILNNKLINLNFNKINKKIINYEKIIFILNNNLNEIKKINKKIELIKNNYILKNEKINIIIIQNKKNNISIKIIKNIFNNYNILGKIRKG